MRSIGIGVLLAAAAVAAGAAAGREGSLAGYWPFGTAVRTWHLVNRSGQETMAVTADPHGADLVTLIYTHHGATAAQGFHADRDRWCGNGGDPWLFLDGYLNGTASRAMAQDHPVESLRILYTPDGGRPADLIANGTYARCGGTGQPFLRGTLDGRGYTLAVWGDLVRNKRNTWFWQIHVSGPAAPPAAPECGVHPATALTVEEAWWSNFRGTPKWVNGDGPMGADGMPSGESVRYGRTDYHAAGGLPWFMVVGARGNVMCVDRVEQGNDLSAAQRESLAAASAGGGDYLCDEVAHVGYGAPGVMAVTYRRRDIG